MSVLSIEHIDDIALVTVNNPPVNALGLALREALWDAVAALDDNPAVRAVVLLCAGRTFIAGADVHEFSKPPVAPHVPDLVNRIEAAAKPWVAAIHGAALGGGFEIALGCRYRILLDSASVGLPEVTLGVLPGASGTVRTPRLAGVEMAIDMVTGGRPLKAQAALDAGLVDRIVTDDLREAALAFVREALSTPVPLAVSQRPVGSRDDAFWAQKQAQVARQAKGAAAPLRALVCLKAATELPFAQALAFEREAFLDLRGSEQAAALRSVFFAERGAPSPAHLKGIEVRAMRSVAVIGGGTMGCGIAAALRDAGLPVMLIERDAEALERGLANLRGIYESGVKRGRLTSAQLEQRLSGVTGSMDYGALADTDLVIEAVFEDLAVKRAVFEQLGRHCRADAILATNTSYIDPRLIAEGLPHPERFIGLHFFSPANIMKLLEIVPLPDTAVETVATAFALAKSLRKVPVEAGICEGFIGNRILKRYRAAAEELVRKGIAIAAIDKAMTSYGFAMGPFEAQDLGGLDIAFLQREGARALGQTIPETLGDILVRAGRKGQKTQGGWYDYEPGQRKGAPSAAVAHLLRDQLQTSGTLPDDFDVAEYLVAQIAQEGQRILEEGIARVATDIDLVEIHGYGFPRWRGGPMFAKRAG